MKLELEYDYLFDESSQEYLYFSNPIKLLVEKTPADEDGIYLWATYITNIEDTVYGLDIIDAIQEAKEAMLLYYHIFITETGFTKATTIEQMLNDLTPKAAELAYFLAQNATLQQGVNNEKD